MKGTITNKGNVRLQSLNITARPDVAITPQCSVQDIGAPATAVPWGDDGVLPVGKEVVCIASFSIGQDLLETTVASVNGVPEVRLALSANATATAQQLPVDAHAVAAVAVSQIPTVSVQILSMQCQVPSSPGGLLLSRFCWEHITPDVGLIASFSHAMRLCHQLAPDIIHTVHTCHA